MKRRAIAALLTAAMSVSLFTGCHDSSQETAAVDLENTDYDPEEAVKDFEFGELSEEEKNYTIEMGYFNCDHMVGSIIGDKAGIYEALGLKVNVTAYKRRHGRRLHRRYRSCTRRQSGRSVLYRRREPHGRLHVPGRKQ